MRRCCLEAPRKEPSRGVRVECIRHLHRSQGQGTPAPGRPSVLGHGCPCGHSWLSLCTGKARCQGQPSHKETQVLLQGRIHRNPHTYGHPPPPSPSHLTQPMRCVTHVRFLVFDSGEMGDSGKQLSSSWEAKQCPQWVAPLSLC